MILLLAPLIAIAAVGAMALLLRVQRGGQLELVGSVVDASEAPCVRAPLLPAV